MYRTLVLQEVEDTSCADPTKFVAKKSKAAAKKGLGNTQVRCCLLPTACAWLSSGWGWAGGWESILAGAAANKGLGNTQVRALLALER